MQYNLIDLTIGILRRKNKLLK